LAAVTGDGVAVVQVHGVTIVEGHVTAAVQPDMDAALLKALDGPELAIRDVALAVRRRELDAIADRQGPLLLAIDRVALQSPRVIRDFPDVLATDGQLVLGLVDVLHARVGTGLHINRAASPRIANDIAGFVPCGPLPIGAGQILTWHEDAGGPFLAVDVS